MAGRFEDLGISADDESEQTWTDRVVGYLRHMEDFEAERAKRLADEEEKADHSRHRPRRYREFVRVIRSYPAQR